MKLSQLKNLIRQQLKEIEKKPPTTIFNPPIGSDDSPGREGAPMTVTSDQYMQKITPAMAGKPLCCLLGGCPNCPMCCR